MGLRGSLQQRGDAVFQGLASAMNAKFGSAHAAAQNLGDLVVILLLNVSENNDGAMVLRKRFQGSAKDGALLFHLKVIDRILLFGIRHPRESAIVFLLLKRVATANHARPVGAEIRGDPKQPCGETGFIAVTIEILKGAHEDFLHHIFGIIAAPHHLVAEPVHKRAVPKEEGFKGREIAFLGQLDQGLITESFLVRPEGTRWR